MLGVENSGQERPVRQKSSNSILSPEETIYRSVSASDLRRSREELSLLLENPPVAKRMWIDPPMAAAFLERNTENNRKVSDLVVKDYEEWLTRGEWRYNAETLKFSKTGKGMDYQHRMWAIINSGVSAEFLVAFNIDDDVMGTIDAGKKRSSGDLLFMAGEKNVNILGGALTLLWRYEEQQRKMSEGRVSAVERQQMLERHPIIREIITDANRVGKKVKGGLSPSILGFIWTLAAEYDLKKSCEFFQDQLEEGYGLTDLNQPAKRLKNWLEKNTGPRRTKNRIIPAAVAVKAWNAYATGQDITAPLYWRPTGPGREAFPKLVSR